MQPASLVSSWPDPASNLITLKRKQAAFFALHFRPGGRPVMTAVNQGFPAARFHFRLTRMKTIVALVDISDLTFKVLKQARLLAKAFDSELILLHVVAKAPMVIDVGIVSPTVLRDPTPEEIQQEFSQIVEMRDSLVKSGVRATARQLDGASMETVLAETRKLGADLIILGSHHHSALYNLLVGSMTQDVLKRAHCPVLVVPGDDGTPEKN
jgi:nucleotide-binding universal stress UspA family protein